MLTIGVFFMLLCGVVHSRSSGAKWLLLLYKETFIKHSCRKFFLSWQNVDSCLRLVFTFFCYFRFNFCFHCLFPNPGTDGCHLALDSWPQCRVSLSARAGSLVKCSTLSPNAQWIAFCDCSSQRTSLRLFRVSPAVIISNT